MDASQNISDRLQVRTNVTQEVVESSEVPVHHMQGMHVLGEAVTQQEFLTDQVIFQELSGSKAIAEMQAHLTDLTDVHQQVLIPQSLVSSLNQTIQSEHAYPISQPEDVEEEDEQESAEISGIKTAAHEHYEERKKERVLSLLEDIESYIVQTYPDVLTILMEDPDEKPFLSVSSKYPDKFLHDQSSLRLNIRQGAEEWLSCQLLTYNREVVRQADIKNIKMDVGVIIEDMIGDRYQYCNGLTFKEEEHFSQKIKKSDIQHILIEKYNGKVFYRSKDCKFIVDNNTNSLNANSESRNHCPECRIFTSTIVDRFGNKSLEDFVVPDNETEQELSKRRRGRPKGSRNRLREEEGDMKEEAYVNGNSIFEGLAELRVGDVEANLGTEQIMEYQMENSLVKSESKRLLNDENDDFVMEDNPSDDDYDVNSAQLPKRGKRKKTLSKKFLENKSEEIQTSGPGKNPKTQQTPLICSEEGCQESFVTVSAFKNHLQEHVGTFVCSEETCIKRFVSKEEVLNHEKKHRGEKPFTCSECKKEYATRQDLKLHFRKHTGNPSFTAIK